MDALHEKDTYSLGVLIISIHFCKGSECRTRSKQKFSNVIIILYSILPSEEIVTLGSKVAIVIILVISGMCVPVAVATGNILLHIDVGKIRKHNFIIKYVL